MGNREAGHGARYKALPAEGKAAYRPFSFAAL
jgi:hypothetical protein